jgi:hypothetical protein
LGIAYNARFETRKFFAAFATDKKADVRGAALHVSKGRTTCARVKWKRQPFPSRFDTFRETDETFGTITNMSDGKPRRNAPTFSYFGLHFVGLTSRLLRLHFFNGRRIAGSQAF